MSLFPLMLFLPVNMGLASARMWGRNLSSPRDAQGVLHVTHTPDLVGQILCMPLRLAGCDRASKLRNTLLDAHLNARSI